MASMRFVRRWGRAAFLAACGIAALGGATASAAVDPAQQAMFDAVWARLIAVARPDPRYGVWPPTHTIEDTDVVNAFACSGDDTLASGTIVLVPHVVMQRGILDQVVGIDADRLAFLTGHELGHVLLGHVIHT